MFCRKCGAQNADNAYKCVQCGEELQQVTILPPTTQMKIPNYLVQAILITLCCCLPFGIVSIVYAAQVNSKVQAGDIQGALDASGQGEDVVLDRFCFGTGRQYNRHRCPASQRYSHQPSRLLI